tara:strand:- start:70 stop:519 length:450 start_codon:yes stop_codon:yes gene_type:complete
MIIVSCTNPNIQNGLDDLRSQILQIGDQIEVIDLSELTQQINELEISIQNLATESELLSISAEELAENLNTLQQTLELILVKVNELPTNKDIQDILSTIEEIQSGIDALITKSDFDLDGVINAVDDCPNTPISEINDVNEVGCSPSQIG